MGKTKILIATGNVGKFNEISSFFSTLSYVEFVSLKDIAPIPEPEETGEEIEYNALLKARYYAEKSGLISLADDSGLFIDGLNGWPGVHTKDTGSTDDERLFNVLERAKHLSEGERSAYFASCMILYNPHTQTWFSAFDRVDGHLLIDPIGPIKDNMPFDPVFFDTVAGKVNYEMTVEEKNKSSHRGKSMEKLSFFIRNNFASKQIVVPCAFILHEGKLLMSLRNDPRQPQFHNKWEFPGGGVDPGETLHENVVREVEEEVGLKVEVVKLLQHIQVELMNKQFSETTYQLFLVPYVCHVVGGELKPSDEEVIEARWFELDDVLNHELIGTNAEMYKRVFNELKEYA
jgi:XTP/dITP diphosphohydrolase